MKSIFRCAFFRGIFLGVLFLAGLQIKSVAWAAEEILPQIQMERLTSSTSSSGQSSGDELKVGDEVLFQLNLDPSLATGPVTLEPTEDWAIGQKPGKGDNVFKLSPLKPGKLTLPSLKVRDASGKEVAQTQPLEFNVSSAIAPQDPRPTEPEGLIPPMGLPFPVWMIILAVFIITAFLGTSAYIFYKWYKNRKPPQPIIKASPQPEDVIALARLEQLEKSDLVGQARFKEYYFKLSEILKEYSGARYGFDALESTTGEMIRHLSQKEGVLNSVNSETISAIHVIFEKLDRVKFTDHRPIDEEAYDLLGRAKAWVKKTRKEVIIAPSILPNGQEDEQKYEVDF